MVLQYLSEFRPQNTETSDDGHDLAFILVVYILISTWLSEFSINKELFRPNIRRKYFAEILIF
jgi:hypothetical protein